MHETRKLFLALAVTTGALAACATAPPDNDIFLNPSFEHATPQGFPLAWYIEAAGNDTAGIDDARSYHGSRALRIRSGGGEPLVLYTPLLAGSRCVKDIDARARAFSANPQMTVSLFYLLPGKPPQMGESMQQSGDGWHALAASISAEDCLPSDLMLGVFAQGQGEAWVDAMEISTNNPEYTTGGTPRLAAPSADDLEILARHAIELESLDPAATQHDLDPLALRLRDTRIVGLGENSHGARALFQLKHRVVRFLVEEMGFTIFALEMPAEQAKTVNDYVLGRNDDDRAALLALTYPAWQSREMWSVITWLREHNRRSARPVTFYGLDTPRDERSDDQRMADQAIHLLDATPTDAMMIIWADNTHITKAGDAMGAQLSARYGDAYVAFGTTFNQGHYTAYGPKQRYEVHPGYPGTHEHVLAQAGMDNFLLSLRQLPPGHVLHELRGFRYIGSTPQELHQFYPHRLENHFDMVGFVRQTDSIRFLLNHEF